MPSFKLNTPDRKRLSDSMASRGIKLNTITAIEDLLSKGIRIDSRSVLEKYGIPIDDINKIAKDFSFGSEHVPSMKSAKFNVEGEPVLIHSGYSVLLRYNLRDIENDQVLTSEQLLPVDEGEVVFTYDDKLLLDGIQLSVKTPTGDFAQIKTSEGELRVLTYKKVELNGTVVKIIIPKPVSTNHKPVGPSKLKGRVLSSNPSRKLESLQIVIEVSIKENPQDADFFPICYSVSEHDGYFMTSQVRFNEPLKLTKARAKVGITDMAPINITLEKQDVIVNSQVTSVNVLPEKLILFLEEKNGSDAKEEGCGCGCDVLDFHEKKALEEFSFYTVVRTTEPIIEAYEIGDVELMDLGEIIHDPDALSILNGIKLPPSVVTSFIKKNGPINKINASFLASQAKKHEQLEILKSRTKTSPKFPKGRIELNGSLEVDWDEKPTIYQAKTIAHGHLLHFKQEWFNAGYTIGDLLYSLPLAPGQKKQIVVFDWDRKDSASNTQQLDYQEKLYNSLSRDRDINEVARATVSERIDAESESSTWGWGVGGGVGAAIPIPAGPAIIPVGALVGAGGGAGGGSSSASQKSSRSSTASSQQHINDRTIQASNSVRSQRATVIQTVSQGERFQVSAEVIANYNHCHTMTIEYFEVLRHFEARTTLSNVQECLFIPLTMSEFDRKKALRWRDILTKCLKKRFLLPGFDALERFDDAVDKCGDGNSSCIDKHYDELGIPNTHYAEEALQYIEGELYLEFNIRLPDVNSNLTESFQTPQWLAFGTLMGVSIPGFYDSLIRIEKKQDEAFAKHAGPKIADAIINSLQFHAVKNGVTGITRRLPVDATLMSDFKTSSRLNVSLRMNGGFSETVKREDIDFIRIKFDDSNLTRKTALDTLINTDCVRIVVHSCSLRYRTRSLHEFLVRDAHVKNDLRLNDPVNIFTPLSSRALKRPRQEDVELSNSLLHHLNENVEYYHQCIWLKMDPQRRFMLLDGLVAPGKGKGRSVASVVENKLIGIVGNCLVMPVAPGFQLDPTLDENINLYEHYYEDPQDPIQVSLPTKGVYAEAVMGKCNSCEKKDESRFWRWEESPIPDSPTAINPFTLPTPQNIQPGNLQPKDFPAPIINLQNAPAAPDPQGFGSLIQMISKGDLFRDNTGLSENQKNALAALQAAFGNAQFFGGKATELTNTAASLVPITAKMQALDQIKKAKENSLLTDVQAQDLTRDAFQSILGNTGSSTSEALDDLAKTEKKVKEKEISEEDGKEMKEVIKDKEKAKAKAPKGTLEQSEIKDAIKDSNEIISEKPSGEKTILRKTASRKKAGIKLHLTIVNPYGRPIPFETIRDDRKLLRIFNEKDVREITLDGTHELFNPTYIIDLPQFTEQFGEFTFELGTVAGNFISDSKLIDIPSNATMGSIKIKLLSSDETVTFKKGVSLNTSLSETVQQKYGLGVNAAAKFLKLIGSEATVGVNLNFEETESETESTGSTSTTERSVTKIVKMPTFALDIVSQFR